MRRGLVRPLPVVLAFLALTLVALVAAPGYAAPPQPAGWGTLRLDGPPVGAGFLDAGYLVVGTGSAGAAAASGEVASCTAGNDNADLYLISFPAGDGCVQALDASGSDLGSEGIAGLAVAASRNRVIVGLPSGLGIGTTPPNVVAYDLVDGSLASNFRVSAQGQVLLVATDPNGLRAYVATEDGSRPLTATYRLNVFDPNGVRSASFTLRGLPRALATSDDGRFAVVGGNFTQGDSNFGYVHLFDLTRPGGENPTLSRDILQADTGVVGSVAVTDAGTLAAGLAGGTVLVFRGEQFPLEAVIGDGAARVATNADGSLIAAAAGGNVTRLTGLPDVLEKAWIAPLDAAPTFLAVRPPYIFVDAGGLSALDGTGALLWTRPGGAVAATNSTGLGIAAAAAVTTGPSPGTPASAAQTVVDGGVLNVALGVIQAGTPPEVSPGDIAVVDLKLANTGAAVVNATFGPDAPAGLQLTAIPPWVVVRPGEERAVAITVAVAAEALPGTVRVPLDLSTDPPSNATGDVGITVRAATRVTLELQPGALSRYAVVQGQNASVPFVLRNTGNTEARVDVEVIQFPTKGGSWPYEVEPASIITVPRDAVTTAVLQVTVPESVLDGTRNHIIVRVTTDEGASAAAVDFTVNPFEALSIQPALVTKLLAPGGDATFVFKVQNLGTIASNVTISANALDDEGALFVPPGWVVIPDRAIGSIGPGDSLRVAVEVHGPPDAKTSDRLRVQFLVSTTGDAEASAIAFAVVDESLATEPAEEPKREPLGLLAPLASLGIAGAVRRWRFRD